MIRLILLGGIALLVVSLAGGLAWYRGEAIKHEAVAQKAQETAAALQQQGKEQAAEHSRQLRRLEEKNTADAATARQVSALRTQIARLPKEPGHAPDCVVREAPRAAELAADINRRLLDVAARFDGPAPRAGADRAADADAAQPRAGAVEGRDDRRPIPLRPDGGRLPGVLAK